MTCADDHKPSAEILLVEDLEDTVIGLTLDLEYRGAYVYQTTSSAVASQMLRESSFDAVLVDLNIPAEPGGDPSPEHGRRLVRAICEGSFERNLQIGILVITAQKVDLRADEFAGCPGFLGIGSKIGDSRWLMQRLSSLGLSGHDQLDLDLAESRRERIQMVVLEVHDSTMSVDAPDLGVGVWRLPLTAVSEGLRRELRTRQLPFALWAIGNVAARTPDEVRPREFVISDEQIDSERDYARPSWLFPGGVD